MPEMRKKIKFILIIINHIITVHIFTSTDGLEGPLPSNNASTQHTHHEGTEGYKPEEPDLA